MRLPRLLHISLYATVVALCIVCIANAYLTGKLGGYDAKLNFGSYNDRSAMAIAISENVYGFHEGYIGRPEVLAALDRHLAPDGTMADSPKQKDLAASRKAIEAALQDAISLDPESFKPFKSVRSPFIFMVAEDTGLVNLYRFAFALFGYHADSAYQFYFLLLSGSVFLFLLQARGNNAAAIAMLATLFAFQSIFYLNIFDADPGAPTIVSNRNFGTLGIFPALHILLFFTMQNRYDKVSSLLLIMVQFSLLLFVITVRSSATWQWLIILVWFVLPIIYYAIRKGVRPAFALSTPALLVLALLFSMQHFQKQARTAAHEDIYFTDCTRMNHLRWHSAYMALQMHPDWKEIAPSETQGELYGDAAPFNAARTWWERRQPGARYSCSVSSAFAKMGIHDGIVFKQFMKFIGKHKRYVAELYLYYKPKMIYDNVKNDLTQLPGWWLKLTVAASAAMGVYGFFMGAGRRQHKKRFVIALAALGLMTIGSTMPSMFAYPAYRAEMLLMVLAVTTFAMGTAAALAGSLLGHLFAKPFFNRNRGLPAKGV